MTESPAAGQPPAAAAGVAPLPKGRHGLSRAEVEASQRLRLSLATVTTMGAAGYVATPVADVLAAAGVSRQTFYRFYDNKLDAFVDALDLIGDGLIAQLRHTMIAGRGIASTGVDGGGSGLERATAAVDHYLDLMVDNLDFARLFIIEAHAAGADALRRRAALQRAIVDALAEAVHPDGDADDETRFACEAFVAAVSAMVTLPVAERDAKALDALRAPLAGLLHRLFA